MLSDITNEIIDNDISNEDNEINDLISDLTKELQHTFKRLLCGVRHQTLIITTCDFYPNIMLMFEKYEMLIKDILDCMADEYEIIASKNNDNFEKSSNSDIDDSEMTSHLTKSEKEMKEMLITKLYKKSEENIMISVDQAIRILKDICNKKYFKINIQTVNTIDAYNKILIMDIFSTIDFPSCRTSAKHGYAMLASNETSGKDVRKVLKAHPKFVEISIEPGTCVRVRSGDPIPKGANTVVTPKNIKILDECNDNNDDYDYFNIDDKEYEIEVLVAPKINENIRNAGYLIKHNEYIIKRFKRIGSSELGILTLCGIDSILVIKVLSIGVLSISRFEENILGRIYESNRIILTSLLKENGYNLTDFGISACQLDAIKKKIEDALNEVDILVIMGPVNDKDILKAILKECFGANIHFGCLDMKPGKSTTFASCMYNCKRKFFLCMSANPATVPIVAHVVLLPFLNMIHRNCSTPIVMQICIKNHELHLRPKFSWTTAQWTKDETFPRACCSKNQHQNIMKYQKANALLNLPKYTSEVPKLDAAFVPTMFVD
ncbi:PREDICTED: molybdopterin biosynthesis protein CNX1-like [Acromyrmex echinatior]|uniref:molybdopterin biosynthesis protein CNX1-like n=1 Tax=Acromyrmex echinatior TaxID=103372 RepID=UPI000580F5E0|nr:PREDICTED: molybdopterin biosynthesis protein CNX1-like [Acromyrmex echinatior]